MIIDSFTHIYPKKYIKKLMEIHPLISVERTADAIGRRYILDKRTGERSAYFIERSHFDEPEPRIEHMDRHGIDRQVITLAFPASDPAAQEVDPKVSLELAKAGNDSIAEIVDKYPDRFVGIAEVSMLAGEYGLEEFDRAINQLGLSGIQVFTTVAGKPLDSPEFFPFYERAQKYDVPIHVHPTHPPKSGQRSYESEYELPTIFVWPFETSLALGRIVLSGMLEKYPKLKFISHHLGAMISFFEARINGVIEQGRAGGVLEKGVLKKPPMEYFKMLYHDTATYGSIPALVCAYSVFGVEHILFGTDYPFGPERGEKWVRLTLESVRNAPIPEDAKKKIFGENTRRLFKIS